LHPQRALGDASGDELIEKKASSFFIPGSFLELLQEMPERRGGRGGARDMYSVPPSF